MRPGTRACRHCGSPARGNPCWWLLRVPQERAEEVRRSGADSPCDCDAYMDDAYHRERAFSLRLSAEVLAASVLIAVFIILALASVPARGHEWYENACCSDRDCAPVADGTVTDKKGGVAIEGFGTLNYSDPRLRWSRDNRDHLCISSGPPQKLICVYRRFKGI